MKNAIVFRTASVQLPHVFILILAVLEIYSGIESKYSNTRI